jgi:sulfur carrier protein ThiS
MDENLQADKNKILRHLMTEGMANEEDVAKVIEAVLDVIKQVKEEINQNIANNKGELTNEDNTLKSSIDSLKFNLEQKLVEIDKKQVVDKKSFLQYILKEVNRLEEMIPEKADFSEIERKVSEIEKAIPKIPDELTADQIADKLNTLEEAVDIEVIIGLKKRLEDLERKWTSRPMFGGGGFNYSAMSLHIIDDETPVNSGDNLNFTIANTPSPATSLKIYRNGQRLKITEDYTFSNRTITLLTALGATEILLIDYRC